MGVIKIKKKIIPIDEPYLGKEEIENLTDAIDSGWITSYGPYVKKFEKAFAEYVGVKYAKTCFSGSSALILAMQTLNIGKGDEVIIPSLTFSADAFAVSQAGAKVIFVDCSPNRFNLDTEDVKKKITDKTKAIIPTHLFGRPAQMEELKEICEENDIFLIEDFSQAHGAKYKNQKVGGIGDLNVCSFHNKLISTGEGGIMTTNNKELAERFELLKNPASMNITNFGEISINQRMSNLHAAVGLAQLERVEKTVKKKRKIAEFYDHQFELCKGVTIIPPDPWTRSVYWRYNLLLTPRINRSKLIQETKKAGFITNEVYKPLHLHPYYSAYKNQQLPNAELIGKHGLNIPSSVRLGEEQILYVAKELKKIINKF